MSIGLAMFEPTGYMYRTLDRQLYYATNRTGNLVRYGRYSDAAWADLLRTQGGYVIRPVAK